MIKLLVPKMPTSDALLPYLRRIDEARWYTNFGQLVQELEARLSKIYGGAHVVTVSSCTDGLELVWMRLRRLDTAPAVFLPALTFPATILAAYRAGFEIEFIDVDQETWTAGEVSGFGLPEHGFVVDAAGAFGEQKVDRYQTAVFSLHATKAIGAGEGGYIVTWDKEAADDYRRMSNFGFEDGVSVSEGTNAKMSEYHAAVALASLDAWDREPWLKLYDWYDKYLPAEVVRQNRPRGVYPIIAVKLPCAVPPVMEKMAEAGIETRRWYYPPMNRHPLFLSPDLPVTADLAEHLLGLPYHLFLSEEDVVEVCETLRQAVISQQP